MFYMYSEMCGSLFWSGDKKRVSIPKEDALITVQGVRLRAHVEQNQLHLSKVLLVDTKEEQHRDAEKTIEHELAQRLADVKTLEKSTKALYTRMQEEGLDEDEEASIIVEMRRLSAIIRKHKERIKLLEGLSAVNVTYEQGQRGTFHVIPAGTWMLLDFLEEPVCWCPEGSPHRLVGTHFDEVEEKCEELPIRKTYALEGKVQSTLKGHTEAIYSMVRLPTGQLASASQDKTIRFWDTDTGECKKILKGHTNDIVSVVMLPNGQLASGSDDKTIRFWDLDTGECKKVLKGHTGTWGVHSLTVLSNGQLASGAGDNTIRFWDTDTGECTKVLKGHTGSVWSLVPLSNGQLASSSLDHTIRLWNTGTGECKQVLKGHTDMILALTLLQNGQLASGSDDQTIRFWNINTGECSKVLKGHTDYVRSLVVLSNGNLASGASDKTIRVWDTDTGECRKVLEGHTDCVRAFSVLADGRLVSGSYDSTIKIWR